MRVEREFIMDPRYPAFAKQLVDYCVKVQPGDLASIHAYDNTPVEMIVAVIEAVGQAGGRVSNYWWDNERIERSLLMQLDDQAERVHGTPRLVDAYANQVNIIFRGFDNMFELSDVPEENMRLVNTGMGKHLKDQRIQHSRWVLTRMWSQSMAQLAGMSHEAFTDYYFRTVLLDYAVMSKAMQPLYNLMNKTKRVKIVGPGETNLTFSIDGIGSVKCDGTRNIPDGEVYTAPVRNSINGVIHYNTVTVKEGQRFENVRFEFVEGKIIKATCGSGDERRLNAFLDTDEGGRYIGEFAIGFNPHILDPIGEPLFDEKIAGSFHLTPGQCYTGTPADNGNKSGIHWDIVCIQRPEHGGGKIWFDSTLIRKDGEFVLPRLGGLNAHRLIVA